MKNTFFPLTLEKHLVTSDSLIILLLCKCVFWGCFQRKVSQVFLNSNICYLCNVLQNGILAAAGNPSESHHLELNRVWAGKKAWLANRMPFGGFFGMCCSQMQTPRHTAGMVSSVPFWRKQLLSRMEEWARTGCVSVFLFCFFKMNSRVDLLYISKLKQIWHSTIFFIPLILRSGGPDTFDIPRVCSLINVNPVMRKWKKLEHFFYWVHLVWFSWTRFFSSLMFIHSFSLS